ncbi:SUA5 like RNA binding domain containing protein [Cryptosporidium ryanae]|uniref:SUA5 like RNA binding domain containing protein n=1 Tax=Cryptosporidium ryanae TaxID=515981 RepID=UPI00351A127A|nr:SUA5 like RNA binding domain containing protein [Cryptosporidium ryanae]
MEDLNNYAKHILCGELVAIPTETVYGLGGNAYDSSSIQKIYKIKGRPKNNPLICHVYSFEFAEENVFELSEKTRIIYKMLADKFWPGPLTLIGEKKSKISDEITSTGKVGVRCPDNHLTLELIKISGVPIAAPSANRSNHISPTSPKHVQKEFDEDYMNLVGIKVLILDDGECCNIGVESTVLEYNEDENNIVIFRYGAISGKQIELVLNNMKDEFHWFKDIRVIYFTESKETNSKTLNEILSPGMSIKHYSPIVKTRIIKFVLDTSNFKRIEIDLKKIIVIDFCSKLLPFRNEFCQYFSLCENEDFSFACKSLFSVLHQAEDYILSSVENPDQYHIFIVGFEVLDDFSFPLWDRIYRASSGKIIYSNLNDLESGNINIFEP